MHVVIFNLELTFYNDFSLAKCATLAYYLVMDSLNPTAPRGQGVKGKKMVIIEELYSALIEAGASDNKAKDAARAVAAYENQLADLRSDLAVIKWIASASLAVGVAVATKLFLHG